MQKFCILKVLKFQFRDLQCTILDLKGRRSETESYFIEKEGEIRNKGEFFRVCTLGILRMALKFMNEFILELKLYRKSVH